MVGKDISHYHILEKLGEGGMGVVYMAEDIKLQRTVALKFLPHHLVATSEEQARFLQEARAASALNHPNVCTIYAIEEEGDEQFIVMEYVDGKTLRELIADGQLKLDACIGYALQIGEALQEAHSKAIVHRDIKADNIMVNSKNQIKVMDFGLAKLKGSLKLTKTSSTMGTLAYMAPEQIQGIEVDARGDIFSFGALLYEMLTGHTPFRGEHEAAMMYSIMNEEPEPLQHYIPNAQSELLHILDRALEKDREDRYQTVHDMVIDLRRLKKDSSRVSRRPYYETAVHGLASPPAIMVEGKKGQHRSLWVGIAALVVLAAAGILFLLLKPSPIRLNPNGTSVMLQIPFKNINYASISRDGNWVAFPAEDEKGKWDVYLMNTAGGKPNRVTTEFASWINGPDLSPDVSQIVYDCLDEPNAVWKIKLVGSQGGGSFMLADTGHYPKWRPDGERIGYVRVGDSRWPFPSISGRYEIWSVKPDGSDRRLELVDSLTTRVESWSFCWSPDGKSIAWLRNFTEGYTEIMVRNLITGRDRQITFDKKKQGEIVWATNGEILYTSTKSGTLNLWMVPARGGEPTQVTQGIIPILGARISADNKTLMYSQQEYISHLWVSAIDGSNARQITTNDVEVISASFSPDGSHIAFVFGGVDVSNSEAHLYVMDHDGNNQTQLTSGSEIVSDCSWSTDGNWIAYSARGQDEPLDSSRVYLIQPIAPGPPRLICRGTGCLWSPDGKWLAYFSSPPAEPDDLGVVSLIQPFSSGVPRRLCKSAEFSWLDSESVACYTGIKTLRYSIKGETATQLYLDSADVLSMSGDHRVVFRDFRKGREGIWESPVDARGKQNGEARRLVPAGVDNLVAPRDWAFFIYARGARDELWRTWTFTGKEERLGKALTGGTSTYLQDVSSEGKEILWVTVDRPSKLVLVKNPFK